MQCCYFVVFFQSSVHQGHQLLGLLCVVPFLMTLIFMVLPFSAYRDAFRDVFVPRASSLELVEGHVDQPWTNDA